MTDLMKDFDEIGAHKLSQLREAEKTGDGVQLPFPTANIFVYNGDLKQKNSAKDCPMLYFGGWAVDEDKVKELVEAGDVPAPLAQWSAFEGAGEKNTWNGLGSRIVTAAFITSRARWISADGRSGPDFDADNGLVRRHMQWLALLYSASKPWGYVVLTAKGYQAQNVSAALGAWAKAIQPFRKELNAATLPLSAFALTLGTVRPEPHFVTVGKSATSKITPIEAHIPAGLTAEAVSKRFIGSQNVYANTDRLEQAREWLAAWKAGAAKRDDAPAREDETEIPF